MAIQTIHRRRTGRVSDDGRVYLDSFRRGDAPVTCDSPSCPLNRLARFLRLSGKAITLTLARLTTQRSAAQNRRYWALLTCGAESLGWEDVEQLHEAIAQKLLALPPCPQTGLPRRMRTPQLETDEFGRYMDAVMRTLIDFGADLSDWDAHTEQAA